MFQRLIGGLAALAAAACAWTAAAAAPLDAYGKLPSIEQVAISPGGNLIAYVVTDGDQRVVTIQSVDARELVLTAPGPGQAVAAGVRLGGMGSTGRSTGTHLHYEVWLNGRAQNPERFVRAGAVVAPAG